MRLILLALPPIGGMAHYSAQLANALANYVEVMVLTSPYAQVLYRDTGRARPRVIFDHGLSGFSLVRTFGVRQKIIRSAPDIIHDTIGTGYYWTAPLWLLLRSVPLVITLHDVIPHVGLPSSRRIVHRFLTMLAINNAQAICVHGKTAVQNLLGLGCPMDKVFIVPHGAYELFGRSQQVTFSKEPVVLFFGSLRYNKGVTRLPHIAKLVLRRIPNVKFVVAGRPVSVKEHSSEHFREVRDAISYMRMLECFEVFDFYIPEEQVSALFKRSSVVVLPYYEASQSGVVGIAYYFRRPVVATPVGDLPEIIVNGVTGFLRSSDEEIADALTHLLLDQHLAQCMGNAGYKYAEDNLSWDNVARKLIEIYQLVQRKDT